MQDQEELGILELSLRVAHISTSLIRMIILLQRQLQKF